MSSTSITAELAVFGPDGAARAAPSLAESRAYCRRLAAAHYENFTVASRLLPRALRQHFANVYAYCRWADDLADETESPQRGLELLDWWEAQVRDCYAGVCSHPVFVALADTIAEFSIPLEPWLDLLTAFRRDQHVTRYETFDELLDYCRYSANPVGRLVLYLGRVHDEARGVLSDSVCTGLQLANHWQDVARDYRRGRVYLPQAACRAHGYTAEMLARGECNAAFRSLLAEQAAAAERYLRAGLPLVELMPRGLRGDVWLFIQGGLRILAHIRRQHYDVWRRRPTVSKLEKLGLLAGCVLRNLGAGRGAAP